MEVADFEAVRTMNDHRQKGSDNKIAAREAKEPHSKIARLYFTGETKKQKWDQENSKQLGVVRRINNKKKFYMCTYLRVSLCKSSDMV